MNRHRRGIAAGLITVCLSLCASLVANAQTRPLTIIVPYPAGGSTDVVARVLAEKMKATLGRTVIVENRSGAGSRVGLIALKKAPKDGSTVLLGLTGTVINSIVFEDSGSYDFKRDFVGAAQVGRTPMALAVPFQSKANTLKEFLGAHAKDKTFTFGTNGPASFSHLLGLKLAKAANLEANPVPYQGGAPMANDLMAGQIEAAIDALADFAERHRAKKIKVLASFGRERPELLPDVPTAAEQGISGVDGDLWFGFLASSGESAAFLKDFQEGVHKALEDEHIKEKLKTILTIDYKGGKEFSAVIAKDFATWTPVVNETGLKNKK